ncbi:MAG: AAA family ATPase, partial [Gammaproteobacteria bacterium]|nr:AAA family ATPase [Gammaproteobacteria bacterium]
DVFNVLLQVLEDGRLTDGHGRTVDFRNTVIVMTSNLGSHLIQEKAQSGDTRGMRSAVLDEVGRHFRPEFINRVDELVVFEPLKREQIRAILDIQLAGLNQRLESQDYTLELSEAARDRLAEAGFDPVYGARPLKRAIQQRLENPLAQSLLRGEFMPGTRIVVDADGENLTFSQQTREAA